MEDFDIMLVPSYCNESLENGVPNPSFVHQICTTAMNYLPILDQLQNSFAPISNQLPTSFLTASGLVSQISDLLLPAHLPRLG